MIRILIFVFFISFSILADSRYIHNIVEPVTYFVNHKSPLIRIKNNLKSLHTVSLIGMSGIGKTQLARIYAKLNFKQYELVWFIDCNVDLSIQFVELAETINKKYSTKLRTDCLNAQKDVLNYLKIKNNILLVLDNLKINENHKIKDILNWEHNGHLIICSQDAQDLPNAIYLTPLRKKDIQVLSSRILSSSQGDVINELVDHYQDSGYPLTVIQTLNFFANNPNIDFKEYIKINKQNNLKTHLQILLKQLPPSTVKLLNKLAIINNQFLSKEMIYLFNNGDAHISNDVYNLARLGILLSTQTGVYEMHDLIKNNILELIDNDITKQNIEEIFKKISLVLLPGGCSSGLFHNIMPEKQREFQRHIEELLQKAETYNLDVNSIMSIRRMLCNFYLYNLDYYNAKKMADWLVANEPKFEFAKMSEQEKINYIDYLTDVGQYYDFAELNSDKAINFLYKAYEISKEVHQHYELKYNILSELAQTYVYIGNVPKGEEYLNLALNMMTMEENLKNPGLYWFIKSKLELEKGNYAKALDHVNKNIQEEKALNMLNDTFTAPSYILKAEILNNLGDFNQANELSKNIYKQEKEIIKEEHELQARALIQLARSELKMKKLQDAENHILLAKNIYIQDPLRKNNDLEKSIDTDLADALVVLGDIKQSKKDNTSAIENYQTADVIYKNCYKENLRLDRLSELYFKLAKLGKEIDDIAIFLEYSHTHYNIFGDDHPRSKTLKSFI